MNWQTIQGQLTKSSLFVATSNESSQLMEEFIFSSKFTIVDEQAPRSTNRSSQFFTHKP